MGVLWESTDQFGNMFIGVSQSSNIDELKEDIDSLIAELSQRGTDGVITVDFGFAEINGPNPDSVSHVLQVPWLDETDADEIFNQITSHCMDCNCPYEVKRA